MPPRIRIAYLTTHYPALSHTFILREVAALRRRRVEVHTVSMRRTSGEHLLSLENREASQSTHAIRPCRARDLLGVHLSALVRHPGAYLATLRDALSLARPGVKGRPLWQVLYFGEAIMLWRHCASLQLRHIHAHHGSAPADVALLASRFGRSAGSGPRTWSMTLHGPSELRDVHWFGLAEKIRRADAVACISDFARSQLMELVDEGQWAKLRVIHCGVIAAEFTELDGAHPIRPQLLCVGRLVPEKGHAVLLEALALLLAEGHDLEAVIVGSGPLQSRLETLVLELDVAGRVDFRGALAQEEVRRCYASATLVCSSSFAEGVPVVLMEAMASGRPVVATAIAGVRELVRDGETGMLVAPGRAEALSLAVATLLTDPDLRARLAGAGKAHVALEYDVDRSAAELEELFGALLLGPSERLRQARPPSARALDARTTARQPRRLAHARPEHVRVR
jgi:colanic acid/amylovoran biosynthesis glycosyltransferase